MTVREAEGFGSFTVLEVLKITELDAERVLFGQRVFGLSGGSLCGELLFESYDAGFERGNPLECFVEHLDGELDSRCFSVSHFKSNH